MQRPDALNALLEAASEQGGYVTHAQALRLGLTRWDLGRLTDSDDLRRVRRGVYAMRHADPEHEGEIAAWLSVDRDRLPWERRDPDAVLSHETAAALFSLGTIIPTRPTLTLQPDARRYPSSDDIAVHRARLRRDDWAWHDAGSTRLPVTTPARTIVDLVLEKQEPSYLSRATSEALQRGLTTRRELMAAATRRKSRTAGLEVKIRSLLDSAR